MNKNAGQAMVEAVFTVLFMTIIMFAFLQICIIAVDDMTANEAAFVGMRSAAVSPRSDRAKEAEKWAKKHLTLFYPFNAAGSFLGLSSFALSDKNTVDRFFTNSAAEGEEETLNEESNDGSKAITIWDGEKKTRDFSGASLTKQTVKIYYYTKVMFGSLTAPKNSTKRFGENGARRYQSARSRMFASPDEDYYYKAYPGADKFKDYSVGSLFGD
jgi:hypothetical protein